MKYNTYEVYVPNKDNSSYSHFIKNLEKHDPSGIVHAYYESLVGKYEKTHFTEGVEAADRKALNYIKNNDPTGFVKWYYDETAAGRLDKEVIKALDRTIDKAENAINDGLKGLVKVASELFDSDHQIMPKQDNHHFKKPLPTHPVPKSKDDKSLPML